MKKFVFVLMPFNAEFDDIYKLGIKDACKDLDIYCERVDEQYYEGSMLERIYKQINHADYIVADLSTKNPNVFYEVGYAHALNKKVILITQDGNDIPFDMKHYLHIIYNNNNISVLKDKIVDRIKWYLENDDLSEIIVDWNLTLLINGIELSAEQSIEIPVQMSIDESTYRKNSYCGDISISLNNNSTSIYSQNNKIYLLLPRDTPIPNYGTFLINPTMKRFLITFDKNIYPEETVGYNFPISVSETYFSEMQNKAYQGKVVVNMPHKELEYCFSLKFYAR